MAIRSWRLDHAMRGSDSFLDKILMQGRAIEQGRAIKNVTIEYVI